jgi:hypothetical protein
MVKLVATPLTCSKLEQSINATFTDCKRVIATFGCNADILPNILGGWGEDGKSCDYAHYTWYQYWTPHPQKEIEVWVCNRSIALPPESSTVTCMLIILCPS